MRSEGPSDPDRVVDRIQRISAAVFNLEQVSRWVGLERKIYDHTVKLCDRVHPPPSRWSSR